LGIAISGIESSGHRRQTDKTQVDRVNAVTRIQAIANNLKPPPPKKDITKHSKQTDHDPKNHHQIWNMWRAVHP